MAHEQTFEDHLGQPVSAKIDDWRRRREDYPTRAEAIRRLIELGLQAYGRAHPPDNQLEG